MKKSVAVFVCVVLVLSISLVSASWFGELLRELFGKKISLAPGSGTAVDPYQISNCTELQEVANDLTAYYILINNIDCSDTINWNSGAGFVPIGGGGSSFGFTGNFNGNDYNITNLYIARPSTSDVGLFGNINGGVVYGVGVVNASVVGVDHVGGFVGTNTGGNISNSFSTGNVKGLGDVGGFVGMHLNSGPKRGSISNSYSTSNVIGEGQVGGFVGEQQRADISKSYSTGSVTGGSSHNTGGFAGSNYEGSISESFSTGDVAGSYTVGGFIGANAPSSNIFNSYSQGDVTAYGVGGFAGKNAQSSSISNSYSTGNLKATVYSAAGFIGENYGSTAYASYWDNQTSGGTYSDVGLNDNAVPEDNSNIYSKSTTEMQRQATFINWNFADIWAIDEGADYPCLQWQCRKIIPPVQNQTCTDSDGGLNYYVKGITANNTITKNDTCILNNMALREYYCDNNKNVLFEERDCAGGCQNNACLNQTTPVQNQTCTDSDGGLNYNIKGTTTNNTITKNDTCIYNNLAIKEYYCQNTLVSNEERDCQYRCRDGACANQTIVPPIETCTDSDGGRNYYTLGNTNGAWDSCINSDTLNENFCDGSSPVSATYNCLKGCENGACKGNIIRQQPITTITKTCSDYGGCELNGKCYIIGYRTSDKYCKGEGEGFAAQKQEANLCSQNFECKSNVCINNKCEQIGMWNKFTNWFGRLVSKSGANQYTCTSGERKWTYDNNWTCDGNGCYPLSAKSSGVTGNVVITGKVVSCKLGDVIWSCPDGKVCSASPGDCEDPYRLTGVKSPITCSNGKNTFVYDENFEAVSDGSIEKVGGTGSSGRPCASIEECPIGFLCVDGICQSKTEVKSCEDKYVACLKTCVGLPAEQGKPCEDDCKCKNDNCVKEGSCKGEGGIALPGGSGGTPSDITPSDDVVSGTAPTTDTTGTKLGNFLRKIFTKKSSA